jgi:hypothetical protein
MGFTGNQEAAYRAISQIFSLLPVFRVDDGLSEDEQFTAEKTEGIRPFGWIPSTG